MGYTLKAEAGIVNYYPTTASMGAHVDDAELVMDHPIVSISLGNLQSLCCFKYEGEGVIVWFFTLSENKIDHEKL